MKKITLCVFSLLLFLLVFCTILAPQVEQEMRTMVEVKLLSESMKMYNHQVPVNSIKWPDGAKIYHIVEGKGWSEGDRIRELSPQSYYLVRETVFLFNENGTLKGVEEGDVIRAEVYPGKRYQVVVSASRQPKVDDAILVVEEFESREDTYIVCYPDGAADLNGFTNFYTVSAQNQQAMVVMPQKAEAPFFEHRVLHTFRNMDAENMRIYSVADVTQFYEMLPLICLLGICLFLGLFLWGYSCVLAGRGGSSRRIWRNAGLGAILLGVVFCVTPRIDLPASLLPKNSILDLGYYRSEFRQIFAALDSLGSDLLVAERTQCAWLCAGMLAAAVLLAAFLVFVDSRRKRA